MNSFSTLFNTSMAILDGGFGTTLEQMFQVDISDTPLWSAKTVVESSDVVVQAHLAFLRAGAEVISTSTYQCSYSTFEQAGYSPADAKRIILRSVELARQARNIFRAEQLNEGKATRDVRIALSLGPFGASLSPAQEFDGFYPPPYGPRAYSSEGGNLNSFGPEEEQAESKSIHALAQFHLERLLVVFEDDAAWQGIDCIAFETVPLTREIRAIRQAMGWLNDRVAAEGTSRSAKAWWISMVFPDGIYPETTRDGFSRITMPGIISAAIGQQTSSLPSPSALGINCTRVEYLPTLVLGMEDSMKNITSMEDFKPWLALYPNGGDVYDPVTQTWKESGNREKSGGDAWAKALCASYPRSDLWGGVILGSCCRTLPAHIDSLKQSAHLHHDV